jgi:nitroreductase
VIAPSARPGRRSRHTTSLASRQTKGFSGYIDTGFTALLILLAAAGDELGAVFFGPPDIAGFRARFGVPDEWTPIGAIAVGHPDLPAGPVPPARASERKSLDEPVHRSRW